MMKRLLTTCVLTAAISAVCASATDRSTVTPADEDEDTYYGDTLYQYAGKTAILMLDFEEDNTVSSLTIPAILTFDKKTPVDTCVIHNFNGYKLEGRKIKFVVGVDTATYHLTSLPSSIDPVRKLLPRGVVRHECQRSFALSDSSWRCDFSFVAYLPEKHPVWMNRFVAVMLNENVESTFLDSITVSDLDKYHGTAQLVDGINPSAMTPEQIAEHFARKYERLYRNLWGEDSDEYSGPKYDLMMDLAPVWTSQTGTYVTYRFYTYSYTGGAHGYMEEFYLTFNNQTGRLLGYKDIIGKEKFAKAKTLLRKQLATRHQMYETDEADVDPALHPYDELTEANVSHVLKEKHIDGYYPRPAITKKGIVFSYQPYEQGSFAEGILHFVIPTSKLHPLIR